MTEVASFWQKLDECNWICSFEEEEVDELMAMIDDDLSILTVEGFEIS